MRLPDAEDLLAQLAQTMRPHLGADAALAGIRTGGAWVAQRLHAMLGLAQPLGAIDVSFYRDDFERIGLHPEVQPTEIPFTVEGRDIVLVDDVLYTGRTVRAAINELFDYGRPKSIRLAVLVDRGGRELPVAADFVGAALVPPANQHIVLLRDTNGKFNLSLEGA
jgi:pyrimidine operon attenuation protein/uracil phosphoribosyltransferase